MDELRVISDSGVFETLVLNSIVAAAFQEGVYHNNIFLTLQLSSPYMASSDKTSKHEVSLTSLIRFSSLFGHGWRVCACNACSS